MKTTTAFAFLSLTLCCASAAQALTINTVPVSNPGKAANSTGFGAVAGVRRVEAQFVEFQNQVNVDQSGNDIVGDAANEPSIAVNPNNPNQIAIGWRQFDTISSNFRQAGVAYSIDAVWNDTRSDESASLSELYYSYSLDAGDTWREDIPISLPFDQSLGYPNQDKLGDYYDMVSDNGGVNLAFAATFNGGQDVFFQRISSVPEPSSLVSAGLCTCCLGILMWRKRNRT